MAKTSKLSTLLEPEVEEMFRSLASKKGVTVSVYIRSMIIEELRIHGVLPLDAAFGLFKGTNTITE